MSHLEQARKDAVQEKSKKSKKPPKEKKSSSADVLIAIAQQNARLFHDGGRVAYAVTGAKSLKVKSRNFKLWLSGLYHQQTGGKAANAEALQCAMNTLEAHAIFRAPEEPVYIRIAERGGAIYFSVGDDTGTVIEIDSCGWRVASAPPVNFLSTLGQMAAPMPERGGDLADLRHFINCPDDDAFALLRGWLSTSMRSNGPFPLLVLSGVQGSAKSTTARILKMLIDPEKVRDRSAPRKEQDLAIWANNSLLLSADNLSSIPDWLSDAFCRLSTGGGFGTRTLYENEDETVFDAKRPAILNGIEDFVTRAGPYPD